jgi:hypothetical protein
MSLNLKAIVNYESLYELRLCYPNNENRYVGITMMLRSSSSEAAKAVIRKHINDNLKTKGVQRKATAENAESNELEQLAASIASWKWEKGDPSAPELDDGEQAEWDGDADPKLTMSLAMQILDVPWIYRQVKVAVSADENFMPSLQNR